jgi:hypothetical protein
MLLRKKSVGESADIYSLGVLIGDLLSFRS